MGHNTTHFLAIQSSAGGRDGLKHFVKACHQRGIAVIMDVVYNHYALCAARAAWQYDSVVAQNNIYYWYDGDPHEYADPEQGYVDNESSGLAPRYHDDHVRALFVSSAVALLEEFHIDGLRIDQTGAIHSYNKLRRDRSRVDAANMAGLRLLRELCHTVKAVWPDGLLIAEDHTGCSKITEPAACGGIGFDATWYVDFFYHLVGRERNEPQWAKLLVSSGHDQRGSLQMGYFAGALHASADRKVVYEESHDEAGNHEGTQRTILAAVNGKPLVCDTRRYAEARCRFARGMSMLSAGTPMFFMGEEVGAQKPYLVETFLQNNEDLEGERLTTGAFLFRFYQDAISLRVSNPAFRSDHIDVVHANDDARVIAFRRWTDAADWLVVGSLSNDAHDHPSYRIEHPTIRAGTWAQRLNSDAVCYGGAGIENQMPLQTSGAGLDVVVPANSIVALERIPDAEGAA